MDVKPSFLNGKIEEEVYIEKPKRFELHGRESHVCNLKKDRYGLKWAPRAWYARINNSFQSLGFSKSIADSNLYIKVVKNQPLILVLYVNDLFLTEEEHLIAHCKRELVAEIEMKDLGFMHYFLGLEFKQDIGEMFLSEGKYVRDILHKFSMTECKTMSTPMVTNLKELHDGVTGLDSVYPTQFCQLIRSLLYLVHIRTNIHYVVINLS